MSYLDVVFIVLLVLKYYTLIDISWGWVAVWGVGSLAISIINALAKEAK